MPAPMLTPYRDVLAHPGALRFSLAGLLARLPIGDVADRGPHRVRGAGALFAAALAAGGPARLRPAVLVGELSVECP